ncbi:bridging integrator 3-like [Gigantopelta aegis]|uniref:bridging integrator 3-like n=1 Tax=Gigantopelta aegis TaxID=1735272 RepID=UPI001B88B6AB|nr:bridging integrator 3-like [Gigantopelta aegis]
MWNPFSRHTAPKKPVTSRTAEREFENKVKKCDELEEVSKKLYKGAKRWMEANNALVKSERKITQDLLLSALCQNEDGLQHQVTEWDHAVTKLDMHMQEMNTVAQKTVIDPMKKFNSIFASVQAAIKKREQSLQEFQKCKAKVDKYSDRDRTGQNIVKLDSSKKMLALAKEDFETQNSQLSEDLPKLYDSRIDYFQPCLEALIKAQVTHNTEAFRVYTELESDLNGFDDLTNDQYESRILQTLSDIKALSITVDD